MGKNAGNESKYGYFVRFNTDSFSASGSVGDVALNEMLAQNAEFCFYSSAQARVNVNRFNRPIYSIVEHNSHSLVYSAGPFPLTMLPDGSGAPLYVQLGGQSLVVPTASIVVAIRQAQYEAGTYWNEKEVGRRTISGSHHINIAPALFAVSGSSFTSSVTPEFVSVLELDSEFVQPQEFLTYTSRSVGAPRLTSNQLMCCLDVFVATTGSSASFGLFELRNLFAWEFIPRSVEASQDVWTPASIGSKLGWWKASESEIDDGRFSIVYDLTGNGNDQVQANQSVAPTAGIFSNAAFSKNNLSMRFNGTSEFLRTTGSLTTPGSPQSLWYIGTLDSTPTGSAFPVGWGLGDGRRGIRFFDNADIRARITTTDVIGPNILNTPALVIANNNGSVTTLYVNGVLQASATQNQARNAPVFLGAHDDSTVGNPAGQFFSGSIAEAGISSGSLSASDIENLYRYAQRVYGI